MDEANLDDKAVYAASAHETSKRVGTVKETLKREGILRGTVRKGDIFAPKLHITCNSLRGRIIIP